MGWAFNASIIAAFALILTGITLVQASELTKITVTIIGEAVIILDSYKSYIHYYNYRDALRPHYYTKPNEFIDKE